MTLLSGIRLIDGHCHLASDRSTPHGFINGVVDNMLVEMQARGIPSSKKRIRKLVYSQHQDHLGDLLVQEMDAAGIEKTVLLAPDLGYVFGEEVSLEALLEQHCEVKCRHPNRFYLFLGADPRRGEVGLALFKRAVEQKQVHGFKVYPPCGYSVSDKRLYPFYEICAEYGLPVLTHTGPTSPTMTFDYSDPNTIDQAAMDFPSVNFILAHGGVNNVHAAVLMCKYRSNVYLDFSGFPMAMHPKGWLENLRELFSYGINHKIIFGTDWPVFKMQGELRKVLGDLTAEDGPMQNLEDYELQNIFSGNLLRVLPSFDE